MLFTVVVVSDTSTTLGREVRTFSEFAVSACAVSDSAVIDMGDCYQ